MDKYLIALFAPGYLAACLGYWTLAGIATAAAATLWLAIEARTWCQRYDELDAHYRSTPQESEFDRLVNARLAEFKGPWPTDVGGVE